MGECGDARESGDLVGGPCGLCQGVLGVDEDEPESELVLEGVVLHNVTPIAGGIANREKDGLVLSASSLKGSVAPRVPPDRIIFMLA